MGNLLKMFIKEESDAREEFSNAVSVHRKLICAADITLIGEAQDAEKIMKLKCDLWEKLRKKRRRMESLITAHDAELLDKVLARVEPHLQTEEARIISGFPIFRDDQITAIEIHKAIETLKRGEKSGK